MHGYDEASVARYQLPDAIVTLNVDCTHLVNNSIYIIMTTMDLEWENVGVGI